MLDSAPQLIYTYSNVRQRIDGPHRSFLTRVGREGDPSPYYHAPELYVARMFETEAAAHLWLAAQRPEVREALQRGGFAVTAVAAQVVPLPAMAPAGATAGLSDADIDAMMTENAIGDGIADAVGDAIDDAVEAGALGVPVDTLRRMLDLAAAGLDRDADRDSRQVEMAPGLFPDEEGRYRKLTRRLPATAAPGGPNHDAEARRAQLARLWAEN